MWPKTLLENNLKLFDLRVKAAPRRQEKAQLLLFAVF